MTPRLRLLLALCGVTLGACSGPANGTVDVVGPSRAGFAAVDVPLVETCGSLDCHGQPGRNLSLWGRYGRRLLSTDMPSAPATTADEDDLSYRSVVGLEPEIMAAVVSANGAQPERLTLIRKARGTEAHKGGTLMSVGDPLDRCITTWLAGQVDASACKAAQPVHEQ